MMRNALVALLSASALVSAAPVNKIRREAYTCQPNFQGTNVQIGSVSGPTSLLWSSSSNPAAAGDLISATSDVDFVPFRFEFTGAPANDYLLKLGNVPDNGLGAIEVLNYNALAVAPFDAVCIKDAFQLACGWCASPDTPYANGQFIGTSCSIIDSESNLAVQQLGGQLYLAALDTIDASFYYNFAAAL